MLDVGASFDFFAGNVKESPEWMGVWTRMAVSFNAGTAQALAQIFNSQPTFYAARDATITTVKKVNNFLPFR
jgi:hypothetical protein